MSTYGTLKNKKKHVAFRDILVLVDLGRFYKYLYPANKDNSTVIYFRIKTTPTDIVAVMQTSQTIKETMSPLLLGIIFCHQSFHATL